MNVGQPRKWAAAGVIVGGMALVLASACASLVGIGDIQGVDGGAVSTGGSTAAVGSSSGAAPRRAAAFGRASRSRESSTTETEKAKDLLRQHPEGYAKFS
jgi:hypothetical protein